MINEPCPAHYHKCSEHSWPGLVSGVCLDDSLGWQVQVSWVSSLLSLCLTFPPFQCKNNFISPARAPVWAAQWPTFTTLQLMLALHPSYKRSAAFYKTLVDFWNHDYGINSGQIELNIMFNGPKFLSWLWCAFVREKKIETWNVILWSPLNVTSNQRIWQGLRQIYQGFRNLSQTQHHQDYWSRTHSQFLSETKEKICIGKL